MHTYTIKLDLPFLKVNPPTYVLSLNMSKSYARKHRKKLHQIHSLLSRFHMQAIFAYRTAKHGTGFHREILTLKYMINSNHLRVAIPFMQQIPIL